ncbi:unnamed protein product [Pseudo-nitzschia multistriata]|uniref:UTP-monosaccharide-1-phosphate uridylyltransferase n=1 Tax=Pseudo-nitzschia multistriata TaxID=183589 RepID=A0A448Z413_9STRA|nr:unnamed protein product [Pseudo-nitzschia multistriata]
MPSSLPENLEGLIPDDTQRALLEDLCSEELGQAHLLDAYCEGGSVDDDKLRSLCQQLVKLDGGYPGGLRSYVQKAKKLLQDSKAGVNPLDGWAPSVPQGESFELGTDKYRETESKGMELLEKVGFVLVAGGLGERLGYNGAKIGLPTESTTGTLYIEYYASYILAAEKKRNDGKFLPLCIMVSNDTKEPTLRLLRENKCFGLKRRQIYIVQQGDGVPALVDNEAHFAVDPDDPYRIITKPHGHGDIHSLLYKEGVTKEWQEKLDIEYMVLFQDTNGLAFHTLPLLLGVSKQHGFIMNSLCVPRKANQAIGGITTLTNSSTGQERTVNVEYNQLNPLLRSTEEFKDGDVNDESTGYSPFPGNINQLVFHLDSYNKVLERTKGVMPDFVNPKYKDNTKTVFKKPTRLECMMQEFPTVLSTEESTHVGFTQAAASICFSPVKNAVADGAVLQAKGTPPGTAATGEADQYAAPRIFLRSLGCDVKDADPVVYNGIEVVPGPAIVFGPDFACCQRELEAKFPCPEKVKISPRSTLVVRGSDVVIESLDLDGTLVVDAGAREAVTIKDLVVKNEGWVQVPTADDSEKEIVRMRGFIIDRKETETIKAHNNKPDGIPDDSSIDDSVPYEVNF